MKQAIRRSVAATRVLLSGLQTALPAISGIGLVPLLVLVLPVFPEAIKPVRALADLERQRCGRLGKPIPRPYRKVEGTRREQALIILQDPATWRDLAWLFVEATYSTAVGVLTALMWPTIAFSFLTPMIWWMFPPGEPAALLIDIYTWEQALTLPFLQVALYTLVVVVATPPAAKLQLWLDEQLLRPTRHAQLTQQIEHLTETRTEALESHGAELRRIERDLHDGIQAQLVSVSVRLGLAERAIQTDPSNALALVKDAQAGIEDSLSNLRGIIRGIYPPILADRGLSGALHALAGGQRIPVSVSIPENLPRPPAPVEAAAYFVVAESLTNVTKHSTAEHAEVIVEGDGKSLRVVVRDDGQGGADQEGGSGLLGIQRRVAALDGKTTIQSPVNVGTTIEVVLPCA